jgi:hypothetical protein
MTPDFVKAKLIDVLQTIQAASGLECPSIVGTTKPLEELPQFDSKIWPVATGMLAVALGINIGNDVNIFSESKSCTPLTIDKTVAIVVALMANLAKSEAKRVNAP